MFGLIHHLPDMPELPPFQNHSKQRKWASTWSKLVHEELTKWTDDSDLVKAIIEDMIEDDPDDRPTAEQCLRRGLNVGLFRRNLDDFIIADDIEVATPAEVAWQTDSSEDGRNTPKPESPRPKHPSVVSRLTGVPLEDNDSVDDLGDDGSPLRGNRPSKRPRHASQA